MVAAPITAVVAQYHTELVELQGEASHLSSLVLEPVLQLAQSPLMVS
jgi:hypothetical protein